MQFNSTHSAILRGKWLVDKQWADAHMPLVFRLLNGEQVDFGISKANQKTNEISLPLAVASTSNVFTVSPNNEFSSLPASSIAIVNLEGPLLKRGGMCSYGMVDQADLIKDLADCPNVTGIILNIDSPGGEADGTQLLADTILEAKKKRPIIALINDGMAASAAMWIASAATEIFVTQKTDQIGSIGVFTKVADWNSHYKDYLKLSVQDIYAPQSTEKNIEYREAIGGNIEPMQEDLSVLAEQFINAVAKNREGKIKGEAWKTGKMFYATEGKKIGLIDGIATFDQVIARITKLSTPNISNPNSKKTTTMSFEKTLTAAKATAFAVTDEGFAMQEAELTNVENEIARLQAVEAELTIANATILTLNENLVIANSTATQLKEKADKRKAKITTLEAEITRLGGESSGTGTSLAIDKDETPNETVVPAYANASSPENVWLEKQLKGKNLKKVA